VTARVDLAHGTDGLARCAWVGADPLQLAYHDAEWGRPVYGEAAWFERLSLEAFQSGLSWATVLRKRESFRSAFAGFDPDLVAAFTPTDRDRLLADAGIIRNAAKIDATIRNARAVLDLREVGGLEALVRAHRPERHTRPASLAQVPATSPESRALARALKGRGFAFVGPTTMYAAMQACGIVDDHVAGCHLADAG